MVRRPDDRRSLCTHADCWTVPHLTGLLLIAVDFNQHRVINLCTKSVFNRIQIRLMAVRGQLHTVCKSVFQIMDEVVGRTRISCADIPARHEFRFSINCRPCPNVAMPFRLMLRRSVLFFTADKRPNFITLQSAAFQIAKCLVLVGRANATGINQELYNTIYRRVRQPRRGTYAVTLNQATEDLSAFNGVQFIHNTNVCLPGQAVN